MNTKEIRRIQSIGTAHDVIEAIITLLEEQEKPVKKVVAKK